MANSRDRCSSFAEVGKRFGSNFADGILAYVGVSSLQRDDAARGFSFQADGPLDMRMNPRIGATAEQVVNRLDERRSRQSDLRIRRGKEVAENRQSHRKGATDYIQPHILAEVIAGCVPTMKSGERHYIHPATRTFQALRIFVNGELDDITALLEAAPRL